MGVAHPIVANEEIAKALGIDTSKHDVLSIALHLDPRSLPVIEVRYLLQDASLPAVTDVLKRYELRPLDA